MADWNPRANDLFLKALDLPADDRPAFLAVECGADEPLNQAVEALLRAHAAAGGFLAAPHPDAAVTRTGDGHPTGTFDPATTRTEMVIRGPFRDPDLAPPGYEIVRPLGVGGMGVVYLARQVAAGRNVALKMIRSAEHASAGERARFRAEAEAAAKLQHPGIVSVYEVGEHRGMPFFTLELCDGGSLADKLDGTPWTAAPAARLVEMVADAVHAAHRGGVIHRDLKPANVLIARLTDAAGTARAGDARPLLYAALRAPHGAVPKVTDFGISKRTDSPDGPTATGAVMGTPSYMAPEQASGDSKGVGPTADVWAIGAVLYELLTGRPPFKAATVFDTLELVRSAEPVAVRDLNPAVPRDLETVTHKCLQKDPARRYASAADLADDLRRFQEGRPVIARPVGAAERAWRWCRRNPVVAGLTAAVVLVLVAGAVVSTLFGLHARDEAVNARKAKKDADDNADRATRNEATAVAATGRSRRLVYDVRMGRASEARNDWAFGRLGVALDEAAQADGGPDPRGWEWHYLDRLTRADATRSWESLAEGRPALGDTRLSSDGKRIAHLIYLSDKSEKFRFEVIDLATATRLESRETEELKIDDPMVDWKIAADFRSFVGARGASDGRIHLWDLTTGKAVPVTPRKPPEGEEVELVAVGPKAAWAVLYAHPCYRMPDEPVEPWHQSRFLRWDRATDRWTTFVIPPAKGPDGMALSVAVNSVWHAPTRSSFSMPPLSDGKRLLTHTSWYGPNPKPKRPDRANPDPETSRWECWDVTADPPKPMFLHESPGDQPFEMKVSPNGEWAATLRNGELTIHRVAANLPVAWRHALPPPDPPDAISLLAAVGNDGNTVVTHAGRNRDFVRNAVHLTRVHTRAAGPKPAVRTTDLLSRYPMYELLLSDDGTRLVAQGGGQFLTWDLTREREFGERPTDPLPPAAKPGPIPGPVGTPAADRTVFVRWERNGPLLVGRFNEYLPHAGPPKPGQTSAGARQLRSGVHLHDAADGKHRVSIVLDDYEQDRRPGGSWTQFDPTHRYMAVPAMRGNRSDAKYYNAMDRETAEVYSLRLFDAGTGAKLWEKRAYFFEPGAQTAYPCERTRFTPDGEHLVFASNTLSTSTLSFARCADGEVVKRLNIKWEKAIGPDPNGPVMRFSPDGRKLYVQSNQECGVWDVDSGAELFRLRGHETSILNVVFSPDGERLFLRENGTPGVVTGPLQLVSRVHVWDVVTGQRVLVIPVPQDKPKFGGIDEETMWFRDGKLFVQTAVGVRVFDGNPVSDR